MAQYIVPAEMPKSCAHCQFSMLIYSHPFWSKENPNKKGYRCPFNGLTLELDFNDYTTKADWCPLVAIEDTADFAPNSEVDWHREAELNAQRIMELEVELKAMRGAANSYKMHYENLAREIFEELETVLCYSAYPRVNANRTLTVIKSKDFHIRCDDYNAIKKKYIPTEAEESKAEEQKFFTPEEVRKMSPSEVRKNYKAIMESMKKWK